MAGYARGRDAVKVGLLAVAAAIAFGALFMKMTDRGLNFGQWEVQVRIPTADGLMKRDRVIYRGVMVGEVLGLRFMTSGDVLLRVRLTQRLPLTRTASAELVPLDLFGRQSLVLRDGTANAPALQDGDTISAPGPESVPGRVAQLAERSEALLSPENVALLQQALGGAGAAGQSVAALTRRMDAMLAGQQQAVAAVLEETAAVAANLRAATDTARMAELRTELSGATGGLAQLTARLDSTAAGLNAVLGSLRSPQGSAGLLLNDPGLYQRTTELLASADALLKDIKAKPKKYINVSVF